MTEWNHHHHGHDHDDDGEHCEPACFAQGTLLRMANGSIKAVEDIRDGDVLDTDSGCNGYVLWAGSSVEHDSMYSIYHPRLGSPVTVTKNHGVAVGLLDGTRALAAAKFLTGAGYGDFMVTKRVGAPKRVHHIMLPTHELIITDQGLISESYFCGGWRTFTEAKKARKLALGSARDMEVILPRIRKRDMDMVLDIKFAA